MSITFACENCGKSFTLDDKFAGKKGKCKQCGAVMLIPALVGSKSGPGPVDREISPSRRQPAADRPPVADLYGLDDIPPAVATSPPAANDRTDDLLPAPRPLKPRSGGLYDRPKKKQNAGGGGGMPLFVRICLGILLGIFGLMGGGGVLRTMSGVSSRGSLEATIQERVNLNQQLASILSAVTDVPSAQSASPKAIGKVQAISANLRKLKVAKGLKTDLEDLKQRFIAQQETASKQVVAQIVRIVQIDGAWEALALQVALEELDREEKSIPGMSQVEVPAMPDPILNAPGPDKDPEMPPEINPGPGPGPISNPSQPAKNRPRAGNRGGPNRSKPGGAP